MKYHFNAEARQEFEDTAAYYAARQAGLEERFISAVTEAIDRICQAPDQNRKVRGDIRHCLVKVFPYAIFYRIKNDEVRILAVMHGRRHPDYWKHRL